MHYRSSWSLVRSDICVKLVYVVQLLNDLFYGSPLLGKEALCHMIVISFRGLVDHCHRLHYFVAFGSRDLILAVL